MEVEYRQLGTSKSGGFNESTLTYKQNPTMETYLNLRRTQPDAEIEIAASGGIEALLAMQEEFEKHGFDTDDIAGILDADTEAISKVALQCMEMLIRSNELSEMGETHLVARERVVPPALIDWIITCALDSMSWNDQLKIPRDLIVLIQNRLGSVRGKYHRITELHERKHKAIGLSLV